VGHQVTTAGNGKLVLELLDCVAFDAVLMDVRMPELDGLETTAAIRKYEKITGRHLPAEEKVLDKRVAQAQSSMP